MPRPRQLTAPGGSNRHVALDVHLVQRGNGGTKHRLGLFSYPDNVKLSHVGATIVDHFGIDWTSVVRNSATYRINIIDTEVPYEPEQEPVCRRRLVHFPMHTILREAELQIPDDKMILMINIDTE